jgi:hypothetical protein
MKLSFLMVSLLTICLIVSSCSIFPAKAVYVKPGTAVEIRKEVWLPIWVHKEDGTKYAGKVLADQSWRAGKAKEATNGN